MPGTQVAIAARIRAGTRSLLSRGACCVLLCIACAACDIGPRQLDVELLDAPAGSELTLIAKSGFHGAPVAVTRRGSFIFEASGEWSQLDAEPLDETLLYNQGAYNFSRAQLLTRHDGSIWRVGHDVDRAAPSLFRSADNGVSWVRIAIPPNYVRPQLARRVLDKRGFGNEPVATSAQLRLMSEEGELFLSSPGQLWQLASRGEEVAWRDISLAGVPLVGANSSYPPTLRNYLPAARGRDFELLTVLGEQLMIYRRDVGSDDWLLVSMLPTVDLELVSWREGIAILTRDSVYLSENAEIWGRRRLFSPEDTRRACRSLVLVGDVWLVGTSTGEIWRASGMGDFTLVHETVDASIADLLVVDDAVFASVDGFGVLVSQDTGRSWRAALTGLDAGDVRAMLVQDSALYAASNTGVFRRRVRGGDAWERVSVGGATALRSVAGEVVVGGEDGSLRVLGVDESLAARMDTASWAVGELPGVRRAHGEGVGGVPAEAIVEILVSPDGRAGYAGASERSGLVSDDAGETWREHLDSEVLIEALDGATIVSSVMASPTTWYMLSAPASSDSRLLLWKSEDAGQHWRTVHTFEERDERSARLLVLGGSLLFVSAGWVGRSNDGGRGWSELELEELEGRTITASSVSERGKLLLLVGSDRGDEILDVQDPLEPVAEAKVYTLRRADGQALAPSADAIVPHERGVYILAAGGVWSATSTRQDPKLNDNVSALLAVILTMVLGAIAWVILWQTERWRHRD